MLKLFPMRHQLSHRRHPLHPSSIRDVRSVVYPEGQWNPELRRQPWHQALLWCLEDCLWATVFWLLSPPQCRWNSTADWQEADLGEIGWTFGSGPQPSCSNQWQGNQDLDNLPTEQEFRKAMKLAKRQDQAQSLLKCTKQVAQPWCRETHRAIPVYAECRKGPTKAKRCQRSPKERQSPVLW